MGEMISRSSSISNISDLKKTKVGEGYFYTTNEIYTGEGGRQIGVNRMNAFFFKPLEADAQSQAKFPAKIELPKEDSAYPPVAIDITTSFIVAAAIATRDYQPVHHDRDAAISGGTKDIYLNILATVGLVQYVSPTIQLALGVWVFHEPFDRARLLGFGFIWAALALYSADGWRRSRRQLEPPPQAAGVRIR